MTEENIHRVQLDHTTDFLMYSSLQTELVMQCLQQFDTVGLLFILLGDQRVAGGLPRQSSDNDMSECMTFMHRGASFRSVGTSPCTSH